MTLRGLLLSFVLVFLCASLFAGHAIGAEAAPPADPVTGLWLTEDRDGGIEFYSCGDHICGRFYWLKDDEANGDISRDVHNPDPDKRARPLCGLEFITGFVPDGQGHYTDGTIYSPRHGANFSADMTLADHSTLLLHGYLAFSFLGQTQTWKRATMMPHCSAGKPAG